MNDKKRTQDQQDGWVKKSKTEANSATNEDHANVNNNNSTSSSQKPNDKSPTVKKMQLHELEVPKGLKYIPNFLTKEEETKLMNKIDEGTWSTQLKRRVQHYGYIYDYKNRVIDQSMKTTEIPEFVGFLLDKLCDIGVYPKDKKPDQLIINGC